MIATSEDGEPHAAAVYYESTPDLKIRFLTQNTTRKAQHMLKSPKVAFVVYDEGQVSTLQGYGKASRITSPEIFSGLMETLLDRKTGPEHGWAPPVEKMGTAPLLAMEIQPVHMRLADYGDVDNLSKVIEYDF